ncbi:MAG: hypothetical protein PHR92_05720 [Lachnospiraceae bacterium]|nr:hypothetical protein [Lachnospiraceae bacterium]
MCSNSGRICIQNQQHYCGKKPENIEAYIALQKEEILPYLRKVHLAIKEAISEAVEEFQEQLKPYETSKGTIRIPYAEPLPLDLIADIARWCYRSHGI